MWFAKNNQELLDQMLWLPVGDHDDLVADDAFGAPYLLDTRVRGRAADSACAAE